MLLRIPDGDLQLMLVSEIHNDNCDEVKPTDSAGETVHFPKPVDDTEINTAPVEGLLLGANELGPGLSDDIACPNVPN